jgi:hypothetical protein
MLLAYFTKWMNLKSIRWRERSQEQGKKENTLHDPSPFPLMFARFWKDDTQGTFGVLENLMSCFYGAIVGKHNCQNVQIV